MAGSLWSLPSYPYSLSWGHGFLRLWGQGQKHSIPSKRDIIPRPITISPITSSSTKIIASIPVMIKNKPTNTSNKQIKGRWRKQFGAQPQTSNRTPESTAPILTTVRAKSTVIK